MAISPQQKLKAKALAKKYRLKLVLLFGSRAVGETHRESDFDVAYLPEKELVPQEKSYLNFEFTKIFGHDRVDTVDMRKASPLLLYAVFRHCLVLFSQDDRVFPAYRAYAFKKYVETKPLREEKYRRLREKISHDL